MLAVVSTTCGCACRGLGTDPGRIRRRRGRPVSGAILGQPLMHGGATPPPMHVHPHQEERITVVSGSVRSRSGAAGRVLGRARRWLVRPGNRTPWGRLGM